MTQTIPCDLHETAGGYIIIAPVSEAVKTAIRTLQEELAAALPPGSLWLPVADELHITFAHVVTSNATFAAPKDVLFAERRDAAIGALNHIAQTTKPITVHFDTVSAFPAAVIVTATDDGTYDSARAAFSERCDTPEGSRKPPTIIHSTIARFLQPVPMEIVERVAAGMKIDVTEITNELWLIQEQEIFVQKYALIESFTLRG